jgi:membrane associated rhomboid family serine protease
MDVVTPVFGPVGTVLSLVVSGVLFLLWRRLFRRFFRSETTVVIATAVVSIIMTPIILLLLLWLWALLSK